MKTHKLAPLASLLLLAACACPNIEADWYFQSTLKETAYDENAQIFVALLNRGRSTVEVESTTLNSSAPDMTRRSCEAYKIRPGQVVVLARDTFLPLPNSRSIDSEAHKLLDSRCMVPTEIELKLKSARTYKVHADGQLPNRLPDAWLNGCTSPERRDQSTAGAAAANAAGASSAAAPGASAATAAPAASAATAAC